MCASPRVQCKRMRSSFNRLRPSAIELWYVGFATCLIILIGNGRLLLQRAGLISSAQLIGAQVSIKVLSGTNLLDTFKFTAGAINLLVWGATGLIIYSFLQAFFRGLRTIEYERDFDSGQYVHPQGFTHQAYWRQIVADALLGFILLALLATAAFLFIEIALPDGFAYMHRFILTPTLPTALDMFIGFDIAYIGTLVVYLCLRLVIRHHHVTAVEV